jgi:hypothetical protein
MNVRKKASNKYGKTEGKKEKRRRFAKTKKTMLDVKR